MRSGRDQCLESTFLHRFFPSIPQVGLVPKNYLIELSRYLTSNNSGGGGGTDQADGGGANGGGGAQVRFGIVYRNKTRRTSRPIEKCYFLSETKTQKLGLIWIICRHYRNI